MLIAFALFRPDCFMDRIQPPFRDADPMQIERVLAEASVGQEFRVVVSGPDFDTFEPKDVSLLLQVPEAEGAAARAEELGLILMPEDGTMRLDQPMFGTPVEGGLQSSDFYGDEPVRISAVRIPAEQMPQELIFIPALALLALVAFLQSARTRRRDEEGVTA